MTEDAGHGGVLQVTGHNNLGEKLGSSKVAGTTNDKPREVAQSTENVSVVHGTGHHGDIRTL